MGYEKPATSNGRPPLKANTPRLAGRGTIPPKLASSPASNSPSTLRKDVSNRGPSTPTGQTQEDVSTPVKAFLSSNVTPRSGLRKARVDSASTTPNGTPEGTPRAARPVSMVERWDDGISGRTSGNSALGISGMEEHRPLRAQSVVSEGGRGPKFYNRPLSAQSGPSARSMVTSPESSASFVYADDAKPRLSSKPGSQRPVLQTVFSGYTQHGGNDDEGSRSSLSTSPVPSEERPKFFRANSSAEAETPPIKLASKSGLRQQLHQSTPNTQHTNGQRAASPLKDEIKPSSSPPTHNASNIIANSRRASLSQPPSKDGPPSRKPSVAKVSPRRHTRLASSSNSTTGQDTRSFTPTGSPIASNTRTTTDLSRRSSLNLPSPRKASHTKTSSVSGIDYPPARRSSISHSDIIMKTSPTAAPRPSPLLRTLKSPSLNASSMTSQPEPTPPLSPTRPSQPPGQSKLDHLNELAAKARRERKVLDLEISNSSLLAINRTLEREMRKQKDELRRLRRSSRRALDGRAVSMGTHRTVSSRMSGLTEMTGGDEDIDLDAGGNLSSEADEDLLFDPYDETRSLSSSASSPPPDRSSFGKDTKRLELDFSRHRLLLVDSQKLNQAIKRCFDTTESLISDGKKALEYQIDVSEIENTPPSPQKRGGRVLEPSEDDEDIGHSGQGLLSPAIVSSSEPMNPWDIHDHAQNENNNGPLPEETNSDWDIEGIGVATSSPLASPAPTPPSYHPFSSQNSDLSPRSAAVLKTGWDAIKQDVKTPDGLRAAAPLGLGNYLQSLGWSPG